MSAVPALQVVVLTAAELEELILRAVKLAVGDPREKPMSMKQLARLLWVGYDTIARRVKAGEIRKLPGIGVTRISPMEVKRLLGEIQG